MSRTRRRGFTTIEIVMVLAVIAILATIILVAVAGRGTRSGQVATLASNLEGLGRGIAEFRGDVLRYPSQLAYLGAPLPGGATDICGTTIPAGLAGRWRGPYLSRTFPTAGLPSGISLILNGLDRDPATGGVDEFGTLFIDVEEVEEAVALELEEQFDGATDFGTGSIRWTETAPGSGQGTLRYAIPIRGC